MANSRKVMELIEELERMIENGNTLPFSSKSLIMPDDALEIIDEIKQEFPKEINEAQSIIKQKKRILLEAQKEAETIKSEAQNQMRSMIDESEVIRLANKEAQLIVDNAQKSAKEIRVGTQHYADNILNQVQNSLNEINSLIQKNKEDLKVMN